MSIPREFQTSNAGSRKKTLLEISNDIMSHLGYPQQCVGEISPDNVSNFILDSLSLVSQYKPRVIMRTVSVSGRSGQVVATGKFYGSEWKTGDPEPAPEVRGDVISYIGISPASGVHGSTTLLGGGILLDEFSFGQQGMGIRSESQGGASLQLNSTIDRFLDFQFAYQNVQGMLSNQGRKFDWQQDYNTSAIAYFSNLPSHVGALTLTLGLEHTLGNKYYLPSASTEVGTPVDSFDETISGSILHLTQSLALSKAMKKIGLVRNKLKGGMGQFELDGDTMIQEANVIEERILEDLKSGSDLWGSYNDNF